MKRCYYILNSLMAILIYSPLLPAQTSHTVHILQPDPLHQPSICMVTIDTLIEKNTIILEKSRDSFIQSYNVYKYGSDIQNHILLGNIPSSGALIFTDNSSYWPDEIRQTYLISTIDSCGNESQKSSTYKSFFLDVLTGMFQKTNLMWRTPKDESAEDEYIDIIIYRGTSPDGLSPIDTISSNFDTYVDDEAENFPNTYLYYRIAGIKQEPCNPCLPMEDEWGEINVNLAFSNLARTHLDPWDIIIANKENSGLIISPNPMKTETMISWKKTGVKKINLIIYNQNGKLIKNIFIPDTGKYSLQRENLEGGFYFIHVTGDNSFHSKLLVL